MGGISKKPVKYAVVDAFTDSGFKGNPAAVCLLEEERDDQWMQSVAAEFNLSETCYLARMPASDSPHPRFHLRWFTPAKEIELCGHATLAAAYTCFTYDLVKGNTVEFSTLSGILTAHKVLASGEPTSVKSENGAVEEPFFIELDFPAVSTTDYNSNETSLISKVLGGAPVVEIKKTASDDLFVVLPSAKHVIDAQPELEEVRALQCHSRGLIISGVAPPESEYDFFSRFFCPKYGVDEDPVCGSAHCALATYWSKKLGKRDFLAYAASPRSGILKVNLDEQSNRVKLQGRAVIVAEGSVLV